MNEQGVQTESPAEQDSQSNLSEPQFDDIAIAIAQPVEPLPEKKSAWWRFGVFRRHVSTRALLVILAATVGFASVTFGWAGVQRLTAEDQAAAITTPQPSAEVDTEDSSSSDDVKDLSPRSPVRKPRLRANSIESKPVARKVGEIR